MFRIGLDLGSSYTKGVVADDAGEIVDYYVVKTAYSFKVASEKVIERLSKDREIKYPIYTCGYGREQTGKDFVAASEITSLSKAVFKLYGGGLAIIDIGGQDAKYIKLKPTGEVDKFKLNRKCAAGTGSFIEEIALRLDIKPAEFNKLSENATEKIRLNSFCTVFAISEVIGMIKNGASLPNIVLAVYESIIDRCLELGDLSGRVLLTGGLPEIHPAVLTLFAARGVKVETPKLSQFIAAYGCLL
ncbi:MAG: 2-hydroxyisocaproyl-CoA dehydratase activator HadI [Myxococcota bacterium]